MLGRRGGQDGAARPWWMGAVWLAQAVCGDEWRERSGLRSPTAKAVRRKMGR